MLQRDMAAAAEGAREQSFRAPIMGDTFYDSLDGGGLFSDAAELPVGGGGGGAGLPSVPVVAVRSSKPHRPPKPPAPAAAAAGAAAAPAAVPKAGAAAVSGPEASAQAAPAAAAAAPAAAARASSAEVVLESPFASEAEEPSFEAAAASKPPLAKLSSRQLSGRTSSASLGGGRGLHEGGSMLRTLGHSIRGMLPKPLRKYMDGEAWRLAVGGCGLAGARALSAAWVLGTMHAKPAASSSC